MFLGRVGVAFIREHLQGINQTARAPWLDDVVQIPVKPQYRVTNFSRYSLPIHPALVGVFRLGELLRKMIFTALRSHHAISAKASQVYCHARVYCSSLYAPHMPKITVILGTVASKHIAVGA
jgi:hypothetical protein